MDQLLEVLDQEAKQDPDGGADYVLTNTGAVIRIEASTRALSSTASEAFSTAQRLASLLIKAYPDAEPVNVCRLGAEVDSLHDVDRDPQWRGAVYILLRYAGDDRAPIHGMLN